MTDEKNEKDGLELDKLEVQVPAPEKTTDASRREGGEEKGAAAAPPALSRTSIWPPRRFVAGVLLAGLVVGLFALSSFLVLRSAPKHNAGAMALRSIVYLVSTAIDGAYHVEFKLYVPFSEDKEKESLLRKLPLLGKELAKVGHRTDLMKSIKSKDMVALERQILEVVHRMTGIAPDSLRIEDLGVRETVPLPIS